MRLEDTGEVGGKGGSSRFPEGNDSKHKGCALDRAREGGSHIQVQEIMHQTEAKRIFKMERLR